jgi:hypothetical protein
VIILHPLFTYFINLIIIVNTILLAQDKFPIERNFEEKLEKINLAFFGIFLMELVLKLFGMGFKMYFNDKFNVFDSIIVAISTIDAIFYFGFDHIESSGAISAFRAFRMLRIFKLAKSWKEFHNLLITIGNTLKDISNFSVLLLIFMLIYTLLGMELFAYNVHEPNTDNEYPDSNFNTFLDGFISVFIVLANDGWSTIFITHYH